MSALDSSLRACANFYRIGCGSVRLHGSGVLVPVLGTSSLAPRTTNPKRKRPERARKAHSGRLAEVANSKGRLSSIVTRFGGVLSASVTVEELQGPTKMRSNDMSVPVGA